jgi:hypothetical protein
VFFARGGGIGYYSTTFVNGIVYLDMLIGLWRRGDDEGTVKKEWKKRSKQLRIIIRGKTRCVSLHFESSKRCVYPLYKFL